MQIFLKLEYSCDTRVRRNITRESRTRTHRSESDARGKAATNRVTTRVTTRLERPAFSARKRWTFDLVADNRQSIISRAPIERDVRRVCRWASLDGIRKSSYLAVKRTRDASKPTRRSIVPSNQGTLLGTSLADRVSVRAGPRTPPLLPPLLPPTGPSFPLSRRSVIRVRTTLRVSCVTCVLRSSRFSCSVLASLFSCSSLVVPRQCFNGDQSVLTVNRLVLVIRSASHYIDDTRQVRSFLSLIFTPLLPVVLRSFSSNDGVSRTRLPRKRASTHQFLPFSKRSVLQMTSSAT